MTIKLINRYSKIFYFSIRKRKSRWHATLEKIKLKLPRGRILVPSCRTGITTILKEKYSAKMFANENSIYNPMSKSQLEIF